jgi:hypothetical protein
MTKIGWLRSSSAEKIQVKSGQVYIFIKEMHSRDGNVHPKDSRLHVHDSTTDAPFDEVGPNDLNWYCRTQFGVSIWSTLEHCIERGILKLVVLS